MYWIYALTIALWFNFDYTMILVVLLLISVDLTSSIYGKRARFKWYKNNRLNRHVNMNFMCAQWRNTFSSETVHLPATSFHFVAFFSFSRSILSVCSDVHVVKNTTTQYNRLHGYEYPVFIHIERWIGMVECVKDRNVRKLNITLNQKRDGVVADSRTVSPLVLLAVRSGDICIYF